MQKTILIVEDDANIRELLRLYLEQEGYKVETAQDGMEGMRAFKRVHPDLVLLDLMMPVMDGTQVMKQIREISKTPVIMLTAKGETFDKVAGLDLGADDYVTKPFETRELIARIRRRLAARSDGILTLDVAFGSYTAQDDSLTFDQVFHRADRAMYENKKEMHRTQVQ